MTVSRRLLLIWLLLCSPLSQARQAAVVTAHPLATQAGIEILQQGGNAFDAAVAVSAALAVVEPAGSGLGGGGFWLLHRDNDQHDVMIDGREQAPASATATMYLDADGDFIPNKSLNGPLAAAIPGQPAALAYLSDNYGRLPLAISLEPAIRYAKQGFAVSEHYQKLAQFRRDALSQYAEASAVFLRDGEVPALGTLIKQHDLANTLKQLALHGRAGFYSGDVAKKLIASVRKHGGIWTQQDLDNYRIKLRKPVVSHYQGYTITSAALPSSGGTVLASMLNQLQLLPYSEASPEQQRHCLIEVMRRAYRDRSLYLGDADFVSIPDNLTTVAHARQLVSDINPTRASNSEKIEIQHNGLGEDTSHFSIVDNEGNRVAATLSINYPFGSAFVAKGTGVLLNDEMDDFSAKPGSGNAYGLVGGAANAIAAGKRPLSSMTPTFIDNADRAMVIGTPGGSRIISMVLLGIDRFVRGGNADEVVSTPRFHHQYLPDEVQYEIDGLSQAAIDDLQQRGHHMQALQRHYGNMQVVIIDKANQQLYAASDPRGEGSAAIIELADN